MQGFPSEISASSRRRFSVHKRTGSGRITCSEETPLSKEDGMFQGLDFVDLGDGAIVAGPSVRNGAAGKPFLPQRFPVGLSAQA